MPPIQEGAVFKLGGGAWAYRLPRDPVTGRRKQVGGFKTKGEARAALDLEMTKVRLGHAYRPTMTFGALADEWYAQYRPGTEKTRKTMREWLVRARAAFDDVPLQRLDSRSIVGWYATLPEKSAEKYLAALRQVLNYAKRHSLIDRNPASPDAIGRIAKPPSDEVIPFAAWSEVEAIAIELPIRFAAIPVFAAGTGLRPEEWIALRVGDVDLRDRVVTVRRVYSAGVWRDSPEKGKGARRRVPLRTRVIDALRESGRLGPGVDPEGLLFPAAKGGPIDLHNWRERDWKPAAIGAGFGERIERNGRRTERSTRTPYALRHTYAAWALAAGINIYTLARRMGTSVEMIEKTYGHFARDAEDVERDLLDSYDDALDAADERKEGVG